MRRTITGMLLLAAFAAHAQKGRNTRAVPLELEQHQAYVAQAAEAREAGDLQRAMDLLDQALAILQDPGTAEQRGHVRLSLGDTAGYCDDISQMAFREKGALLEQYDAECLQRDTLGFMDTGLPAARYPGAETVRRLYRKADGRTEWTMLDAEGKVLMSISTLPGDTLFLLCEEMPEYPGGDAALFRFLGTTTKYPTLAIDAGISGTVYVRFVVGADGELRDHSIIRGVHWSMDQEALRVARAMPPWQAGRHQGEPVPVVYNLPIRFVLR